MDDAPSSRDVILLLQGSTANIDAMQTYLDTVNGGIAQLHGAAAPERQLRRV